MREGNVRNWPHGVCGSKEAQPLKKIFSNGQRSVVEGDSCRVYVSALLLDRARTPYVPFSDFQEGSTACKSTQTGRYHTRRSEGVQDGPDGQTSRLVRSFQSQAPAEKVSGKVSFPSACYCKGAAERSEENPLRGATGSAQRAAISSFGPIQGCQADAA